MTKNYCVECIWFREAKNFIPKCYNPVSLDKVDPVYGVEVFKTCSYMRETFKCGAEGKLFHKIGKE